MKAIYFTTVFLVVFALLSQLEITSFTLLNVLFIIGNLLVIFMVYKTLKDLYYTTKKFEHWYEDNPRNIQE
jgi:uncharacterized protein HemY